MHAHPIANKIQPNTLYLLKAWLQIISEKKGMMESPTVPRLLLASEGRIYPQSERVIKDYIPKQIDYRHTIRVITPFQCSHEAEIQRIRNEHEAKLREKDEEINRLTLLLRQKGDQLMRKEEELEQLREAKRENNPNFLKVSTLENKLQRSQVTDIFHSNVKSHFDHNSYSNIKTSYIFDVPPIDPQNGKEVANMEEELQNMEQNLKSLSNALNKPTRTYQFLTRARQNRLMALPAKIERLQTATNMHDSHVLLLQNCQVEPFNENEQDQSVECTSTNESFDATDFLQEAIHEHRVLRDTLIELERSTKAEMEQMKQFYENQIEQYRRMLQIQRDKAKSISQIEADRDLKRQFQVRQQQFCHLLSRQNKENFQTVKSVLDND